MKRQGAHLRALGWMTGYIAYVLFPAKLAASGAVHHSRQTYSEETYLQEHLPDLSLGPVTFGGAARANFLTTTYEDSLSNPQHVAFDTVWADARLDYEHWFGYAQFRFYDSVGDINAFFHSGWAGYRWDDQRQNVKLGITKVPFGVLPFASNNYFFSLAYYVGLEDDYDFGLVYTLERDDWSFKVAYFPREEWNGFGNSIDSSRYSYDVVRSADSANQERNQFNLWVERQLDITEALSIRPGASALYKMVPNDVSDATGGMWAAGIHTQVDYGRFNAKLEYSHYRYHLKNPPGLSDRIVVMGAYGAPYNVAAQADILVASLSYTFPLHNALFRSVIVYNDYSAILKSESGFNNSQQNVTGAFLDMDPFKVYVDFAFGRNNPFIGAEYTNALARGGDNRWDFRFNVNAGLYF